MEKDRFWLLISFVLAFVVGLFDLSTGAEISFSLFYLAPIALAAWYCPRYWGLFIAVLSATIWFTAELIGRQPYSHEAIRYWNAGIRLGFFLTVALLIARLKQALLLEQELAQIDALTGVANSRYFHVLVENELARSQRTSVPVTLAYIDLDNFKFINDHYGHSVGDQVIQVAVETMQQSIRNIDRVGRLGGDEFGVLLINTNSESAQKAIPRLQQNLIAAMQEHEWPITCSIGVLTCDTPTCSANQLFKEADNLMYLSKQQGKNAACYALRENETAR